MTAVAIATFAIGIGLALAATVIDARTHRLPNRLVGPLAAVGVVGLAIASIGEPWLRFPTIAAGAALFAGPWFVLHLASPASIGFGDVKFSAALGIHLSWFDPFAGLWACAFAVIAAFPHGLVNFATKSSSTVPLGPYLLVGTVASALVHA